MNLIIVIVLIPLAGCLVRNNPLRHEKAHFQNTSKEPSVLEKVKTEPKVNEHGGVPLQPTKSRALAEYDQVVERLLLLKPVRSSFEVDVWTDKPVYQIGESVSFYFRSSRDTYLTLLDVGTSGNLRILFPNGVQKENRVTAGRIYTVPVKGLRIEADGPPGLERIKVIATTQPLQLVAGEPWDGFLLISRNHPAVQSEIQSQLQQLETQTWSEGSTEITITGDGKPPRSPGRFRTIKPKKPEKPIDITGTAGLTETENKADPLHLSPTKTGEPIDTIGSAGVLPQQEMPHGQE